MPGGISLDHHALPATFTNLDVHAIDMRVALEEVIADDQCERFDARTEMLVGERDDRVLDGVRRHDLGVVVAEVGFFEVSLEQHVGRNFDDRLAFPFDEFAQNAHLLLAVAIRS